MEKGEGGERRKEMTSVHKKKKKRKREKKKNDLCHIPTCVYNTRRGFGLVFRAAIHCMSAHRSK